jgi:predicted TIM-barrel fold metal-dependent hydrolase
MQHFGISQSHEALSVAKNNKNIYMDTSAVIHPKNIINFVEEVSPNRMMFASDTIRGFEETMPQEEMDRVTQLNLSKDVLGKVLGENASKLLRSVGVSF